MRHRLTDVHVINYPILSVTFEDGLSGEIDLRNDIANKPMFAELKDEKFFNTVTVGVDGSCMGWKLDHVFEEIDFSADGLRTDIETQVVMKAAAAYRSKRHAAE